MQLRHYQTEAISSWKASDYASILEMATGTGKTVTAISGALELATEIQDSFRSVMILIVCPYLGLVDQWQTNFEKFGLRSLRACEGLSTWVSPLRQALDYLAQRAGSRQVVITTNATFMTAPFQKILETTSSEIIFIADEVHNLGTRTGIASLPKNARYRLGLSATPERHGDGPGTQGLLDYFGEISYELSLKDAIDLGCLSPYFYFPRSAKLTSDETDFYADVTAKFAALLRGRDFFELTPSEAERAGKLLRLRGAILGGASAKYAPYFSDMEKLIDQKGQLIYCAEGTTPQSPDERQIDFIAKEINRRGLGQSGIYDANTARADRQRLLKAFELGSMKYLLSMRCLDEGVDIPSANVAYFLASSSNPRQFVQRRGRVLRLHKDKEAASIYDYFSFPAALGSGETELAEKAIAERELARVITFAEASLNPDYAFDQIAEMRTRYGL